MNTLSAAESRLESALALLTTGSDPYRAIALARLLLVLVQIDLGAMREARDGRRDAQRSFAMPSLERSRLQESRHAPRLGEHITLGASYPQVGLTLSGMFCETEGGTCD